jgi:hypothetical protein
MNESTYVASMKFYEISLTLTDGYSNYFLTISKCCINMYLTYYVHLVGIKRRNCLQQVIYGNLFSKAA